MKNFYRRLAGASILLLAAAPVAAKPIAFRGGTSLMYEWGGGTIC